MVGGVAGAQALQCVKCLRARRQCAGAAIGGIGRGPPAGPRRAGWYCDASDERINTAEDMRFSDAALRELRIEVENLLRPQDVKRIREKFGLTQREAGTVTGGGPNAFQKYEQGTVTVSKGISNFLRVLERHPEEIEELKKQA